MTSNPNNPPEQIMHAANEKDSLKVPGCGLPIKHEPKQRFHHGAIDHEAYHRLTVREISMLGLMESLTDKPNWFIKIFDKDIIEKWRKEAMTMPWITDKTWEWCLKELQDKAKIYENTKRTTILDTASRCVKADEYVPADVQSALKSAVKPLLDQTPKDWHPGSNEKVLNLVHPSLYPAVYGKTQVSQHQQIPLDETLAPHHACSVLEPVSHGPVQRWAHDDDSVWSIKFQWLPCDVSFIDGKDSSVRIESYINNLHPVKYRPLYSIIESLISLSIPAWNEVLIDQFAGRTPLRIDANGAETDPPEPLDLQLGDEREDEDEETLSKVDEYLALPDNPENEPFIDEVDEDDDYYWGNIIDNKWKRIRKVIHPEPGIRPSASYENWKLGKFEREERNRYFNYADIDLRESFAETGLQIIVKLASIELTPNKPSYEGGSWHLEGMMNEHIVATSIYYYDVENITESRIRFRQEAFMDAADIPYPQSDHAPLCQVFGVPSLVDEPAIQELGSIATPGGRLLTFPNTLQHEVEPFSLQDPSKPGHRRFLVLWLIDPHYRILSTGNVPPQQHEWWTEKARESVQGKVAVEIQAMIEDQLKDGTMTLDEAKEYRSQLMAERTTFANSVDHLVSSYNFCEH